MHDPVEKLAHFALNIAAAVAVAAVVLTAGAGSQDAGSKSSGLDGVTLSELIGGACQKGPLGLSRSGVVEKSEHSPTPVAIVDLYTEVYRTSNLFSAWLSVRRKARVSSHAPTKEHAHKIDENPVRFIRSLQRKLSARKFVFPKQRAVIKTKKATGKKRGIVVSPIEGRVVQRAILNVFQSSEPKIVAQTGAIPSHLMCPTSVGGIPERGVQYAVSLIRQSIADGAVYYVRSDIKGFFDHVNREDLVTYLRSQVTSPQLTELFGRALDVELENIEDVRAELDLFPSETVGVAQGNSLSCLAANLALRDFDSLMNGRNVATVRYIDDFVVLGKSRASVRKALENGILALSKIGLHAYTPEEDAKKASEGRVAEGFDFLGCYFKEDTVVPSESSRERLLAETDGVIAKSKKAIYLALRDRKARRAEDRFTQSLATLDKRWRGWGDAFGFTTDRRVFEVLDEQLGARLSLYRSWFLKTSKGLSGNEFRRAYGMAVLADTPAHPKTRRLVASPSSVPGNV